VQTTVRHDAIDPPRAFGIEARVDQEFEQGQLQRRRFARSGIGLEPPADDVDLAAESAPAR
jgi:hypothetical protein